MRTVLLALLAAALAAQGASAITLTHSLDGGLSFVKAGEVDLVRLGAQIAAIWGARRRRRRAAMRKPRDPPSTSPALPLSPPPTQGGARL